MVKPLWFPLGSPLGGSSRLSKCIYQFDGGDPARELFVPRRFWGQQLSLGYGRAKRAGGANVA